MKNQPNFESITSDYHLFVDIQMGKYFNSVNKKEFSNEEEAKTIIGIILQTWNNKIAYQHKRLDTSTIEAKTAWFNSVDIDFRNKTNVKEPKSGKPNIREATHEMIGYYDDLFPFLPEGAVIFLLFAGPALEAYGYSLERFNKIIDGEKPAEIEKELLSWAYDITFGVMSAYLEKTFEKRDLILSASVKIAEEELDKKNAEEVVKKIYSNIEQHFADLHKDKNKSLKKRKKDN